MKKAKILMIEDESDVMSINREFLNVKGYETICATTISDARFKLEEHASDLILLDVMLPDGLGWDFCAELRQKTNAPIIFLTCKDENESIVRGLLTGADDYVTKPYDLNVLGARIATQLRHSGIMTAGKIELPPLYINMVSGEVILSGERIYLAQKEMQLLFYFALFAGQRLSCDELCHHAWGEDGNYMGMTIKVHISKLRKKLKLNDDSWFEIKNTGKEEYCFTKVRY